MVAATDLRGERVVRSAHRCLYDDQWGDFNYNYAGLETRFDKGRECRVEYILRSELNGDFHLPSACLYGMYRPDISSNSGSGKLFVGNLDR